MKILLYTSRRPLRTEMETLSLEIKLQIIDECARRDVRRIAALSLTSRSWHAALTGDEVGWRRRALALGWRRYPSTSFMSWFRGFAVSYRNFCISCHTKLSEFSAIYGWPFSRTEPASSRVCQRCAWLPQFQLCRAADLERYRLQQADKKRRTGATPRSPSLSARSRTSRGNGSCSLGCLTRRKTQFGITRRSGTRRGLSTSRWNHRRWKKSQSSLPCVGSSVNWKRPSKTNGKPQAAWSLREKSSKDGDGWRQWMAKTSAKICDPGAPCCMKAGRPSIASSARCAIRPSRTHLTIATAAEVSSRSKSPLRLSC
jgi:hypothetical protein